MAVMSKVNMVRAKAKGRFAMLKGRVNAKRMGLIGQVGSGQMRARVKSKLRRF